RCPCCYPPDDIRGRILSGMGVPDLRGGLGTSTFYTSAGAVVAQGSEQVIGVRVESDGASRTRLIRPRHSKAGGGFHGKIPVHPERAAKRAVIRSEGQPKILEVREGEWSDWLKVKFKTGLLQSVKGVVRFHLVSASPVFELYASPVNFDPDWPMFPIS